MNQKEKHRFYLKFMANLINKKVSPDSLFIECGVKNGDSAVILAKELNRRGVLFDTWDKYVGISGEDGKFPVEDNLFVKEFKNEKRCKINLRKNNIYKFCKMIKGDVREKLPEFLEQNPNTKICFAHLDLDLYDTTSKCLSLLQNRMVGCFFIHDYGALHWPGIKLSVDDFVEKNKLSFYCYKDCCSCIVWDNSIVELNNFGDQ